MYKITKLVCGKFQRSGDGPIKDKQGNLLTTEREQEARWAEHFREVLNRPAPNTQADIQEAEEDLDIPTEPPSRQEIVKAIVTLNNGKTPGSDGLNAELFKASPDIAAQQLEPLFMAIWEEKRVPAD